MHSSKPLWFAVYTRSRAEKKVAREFEIEGIMHYLPLRLILRQWSDRKKKVLFPLIPSYVIVNVKPKQLVKVRDIMNVVKIISFCDEPVSIPEWQINNLKILLGAGTPMDLVTHDFVRGENVVITMGPMKGMRGTIAQIKGKQKLVISIPALDYNLSIDIHHFFVEGIKKTHI